MSINEKSYTRLNEHRPEPVNIPFYIKIKNRAFASFLLISAFIIITISTSLVPIIELIIMIINNVHMAYILISIICYYSIPVVLLYTKQSNTKVLLVLKLITILLIYICRLIIVFYKYIPHVKFARYIPMFDLTQYTIWLISYFMIYKN